MSGLGFEIVILEKMFRKLKPNWKCYVLCDFLPMHFIHTMFLTKSIL